MIEYLDDESQEYIEDDDQYIDENNDPCGVVKITEENSVRVEDKEEVIEFDEIFETVKAEIVDFVEHDHMMEEKVVDALRRGKL